MPSNRVRFMTLFGTVITEFALGSVYTWSLFNAALATKLSESVSNVAFSFGILSISLAIGSSLAGKLQARFGVRKVTVVAGVLFGISLFSSAYASNLTLLYIFAGVSVGFSGGCAYLMCLSNTVKFFPEKKGLVSACAIGAYGLGSLGFKYINMYLLNSGTLESTFMYWGLIAMIMVVIGGLMMHDAPKVELKNSKSNTLVQDRTLAEAIRYPQFWMLALIFLTVCMSGLYVIGVAKDVGENYVHLSMVAAASSVAIIAVANLSGRLILGVLSDRIASIKVVSLALIICLIGVSTLIFHHTSTGYFYFSIACIALSFGGTITVYPSLVSDFFGINNLTQNYGLIYLGFGVGSLIGSIIASVFGGYNATFYVMLVLLIVSLVISLTIRLPDQKIATKIAMPELEPAIN